MQNGDIPLLYVSLPKGHKLGMFQNQGHPSTVQHTGAPLIWVHINPIIRD